MKENKMSSAYRLANELIRDRLKEKSPEILSELDGITEADVIITRGQYDHIESVLHLVGTPFTLVDPGKIEELRLRPDQIVFVNCPGHFSKRGIKSLVHFMEEGGYLFTTDWALKHVLEPGFPGTVAFNNVRTKDDVVRVEVLDGDDPFLKSILGPDDDPQWWLEGSSYPIRILDKERVKVLIKSRELGEKYGESPVFITFDHGEGRVYHMISHFYLQRSETRSQRQSSPSSNFMKEKGIRQKDMRKYAEMGSDEISLGEVESAYVSSGMTTQVLLKKVRQREALKRKIERTKKEEKSDEQKQKES
jgi:hypothetical protein